MVLDRRGFIKFVAGVSAGVMATPIPWKLLDDVSIWTQSWPWIPSNVKGETRYTYAVSKMCPSGVPMKVRLVGNRPVRILPVEDHPLGGGVTALAVAEVHMLHSPARVQRPLKRGPDGGFTEISWKEALDLCLAKFNAAGSNVAFISGDENGSTNEVLSSFAGALGSKDVYLMPSEGQCAAKAAELMGLPAQIGYDLENSDFVLSIGANLLESWGTVVRNRRIFKQAKPVAVANKANGVQPDKGAVTFAYAGPVQNGTAAVANAWLPIYPGTEGILALGIANLLIAKGRMVNAPDFGSFKHLASQYTPAETAKLTGVDPEKLEAVVDQMLQAKSPLVIVGSEFNQGAGAAPVMAGIAVNALLGNINKSGGMRMLPLPGVVMEGATARHELYKRDLTAWLDAGPKASVLVVHEANPVYALPDPARIRQALKDIPFKVTFTSFMDETAMECDLVLPMPTSLERVDDLECPYGVGKRLYCVSTVAAEWQAEVIGTANAMLHLAREMGKMPQFKLYQDVLKAKALTYEKCSFETLVAGKAGEVEGTVPVSVVKLRPEVLERALKAREGDTTLRVAIYSKLSMGTAKSGIPPYNTKTLRASELEGSTMSVMMNGATAAKHSLKAGDSVTLDAVENKIPARLHVFEGVMNDTVAVMLGFGHTALDEFSRDKGANVMELLKAAPEPATGLNVWSKTGVNVYKA